MWKYIKENDLQDPADRRRILNDEPMARVFKCKTMTMLQIAKKLNPHLKKYADLVGDSNGSVPRSSPASAKKPKVRVFVVDRLTKFARGRTSINIESIRVLKRRGMTH